MSTAAESSSSPSADAPRENNHFIRQIIAADRAAGLNDGRVITRFPPEPNGYLHIGHAASIHLNFGLAAENGGRCHLRFDDTNPIKEDQEYIDAIKRDIRWLGYDWGEHEYYASDYFQRLYDCAVQLIRDGHAFVCDLNAEQMREYRGTLTEPGKPSPFRDRSVEENLDLFERMKNGEFDEGSRTLRAKIDMASPNINLRDPVFYRIQKSHHHRTGNDWCIYPMYDFAHGLSDAFETITHSICTLEFEAHRPLYDWIIDMLPSVDHHPKQVEFARINVAGWITSKRKLRQLVEEGHVAGWDDPRMPTVAGIRRRGYSPESLAEFAERSGIAKREKIQEFALLEHCVREDLNKTSNRVMAVLRPLKVVITNYPEDQVEDLEAINNPEDASAGVRQVPFSREIWIEQDDFMEDAPRKFFRLSVGREVRLRYAYFITCTDVVKNDAGEIVELHCTYDPETRGGDAPDGRKVKGTLHWVSAAKGVDAEVRLYDRLFVNDDPNDVAEGGTFIDNLNPDSLEVISDAKLEPAAAGLAPESRVQFERLGYFCADQDSTPARPVFNRTATLRDTWSKVKKQG